LKEHKQSGE